MVDKDVIYLQCVIRRLPLLPASGIVILYSYLPLLYTKSNKIVLIRLPWWSMKVEKGHIKYVMKRKWKGN